MIRTHVVIMTVLVCTGCSALSVVESNETPSPFSAAAAQGPEISGTGYTFNVPRGWGRSKQEVVGFDPDSMAFNLRDKDAFVDNINVLLHPGGAATPEQAEDSAENELADSGVRDISIHGRVQVAGSESAHVTAESSIGGQDYTIEQFYPTHDDQTFIVTFSFSTDLTARQRAKVTEATLVSWAWTD